LVKCSFVDWDDNKEKIFNFKNHRLRWQKQRPKIFLLTGLDYTSFLLELLSCGGNQWYLSLGRLPWLLGFFTFNEECWCVFGSIVVLILPAVFDVV